MECDASALVARVGTRTEDIPLGEQTVAQVSVPFISLLVTVKYTLFHRLELNQSANATTVVTNITRVGKLSILERYIFFDFRHISLSRFMKRLSLVPFSSQEITIQYIQSNSLKCCQNELFQCRSYVRTRSSLTCERAWYYPVAQRQTCVPPKRWLAVNNVNQGLMSGKYPTIPT